MDQVKADIKNMKNKLCEFPTEWEWAVAHRGSTALQRWIPYDENTQRLIAKAEDERRRRKQEQVETSDEIKIHTEIFRWSYEIDLKAMTQRNFQTGRVRSIRKSDRPLVGANWQTGYRKNTPVDVDEGVEQQVQVITMNGDSYQVTVYSKQSVMALKRAIAKIAGISAYEMSLYLQHVEDESEHSEKQQHQEEEEEEQKPLSNRRRLHEFDEPVVDGSVLMLVVGQRMGVGDILVDIENFKVEGKLKNFAEVEAAAAELRRQGRQVQHTAADGRIYPVRPLAAALQDEFRRRQAEEHAGAGANQQEQVED